ncbi:hypothetical protein [Janthinobacterium rivuli]|uniref:hypothetical protein n=1 Tax=Janthinobacterium rivuli TaxID=2751478 RepID=UPI00383A0BF8
MTESGHKQTKNHGKAHEDQTLSYEILVFGAAVGYPGSHIGRYRQLPSAHPRDGSGTRRCHRGIEFCGRGRLFHFACEKDEERISLILRLIALRSVFFAGWGWNAAEVVVTYYRVQGHINGPSRTIAWTGPGSTRPRSVRLDGLSSIA